MTSRIWKSLCGVMATALLACGGSSLETSIPPAGSASAPPDRLAWWSRAAIDAVFGASVATGDRSGYVAVFARDGHVVHATTAGYADVKAERPMALDTVVRIASMTKPITAVAAHILIEEGRLGLDDPVSRYIPAAAELRMATSPNKGSDGEIPTIPLEAPLTVRHLLEFRSGMGPTEDGTDLAAVWEGLDVYGMEGPLSARVKRTLEAPLYEAPGARWRYGRSADVMARVVEVAAGEPFDAFLERRIFGPLEMTSTRFLPPVDSPEFVPLLSPIDPADVVEDVGDDFVRSSGSNGQEEVDAEEVAAAAERLAEDTLRSLASTSHLIGLAFIRADAMNRIISALPPDDARILVLRRLAVLHGSMGFDAMFEADYAGSHWLGTFALKYLLTEQIQ